MTSYLELMEAFDHYPPELRALIGVVLMQRSEGGGLGMGGAYDRPGSDALNMSAAPS